MRHLLWAKQSWLEEFQLSLIYCQLYKLLITDLGIEKQVRQRARQALRENTFPFSLPDSTELQIPLLPCSPCFCCTWCLVPWMRWWEAGETGVSQSVVSFFFLLFIFTLSLCSSKGSSQAAVTHRVYLLLPCLLSCVLLLPPLVHPPWSSDHLFLNMFPQRYHVLLWRLECWDMVGQFCPLWSQLKMAVTSTGQSVSDLLPHCSPLQPPALTKTC